MKKLVVISHPATVELDDRVLKLAAWMGVPATKAPIGGESESSRRVLEEAGGGEYCFVVAAETLTAMADAIGQQALLEFLSTHKGQALVIAWRPGPNAALQTLSKGKVCLRNAAPERSEFQFPEIGRETSQQFSGLGFSRSQGTPVPALEVSADPRDTKAILLADGVPAFVQTDCGWCELFVLTASNIPDINTPLAHDRRVEELYEQLIPFLAYFRHCFGSAAWHGPASTGRLIIDDPLLTDSYGFLDYRVLMQSMRKTEYGTTIAFIPWNHWRTSKSKTAAFLKNGSELSICVHGCDHSNKEFGAMDHTVLQWKASTAMGRMNRHKVRTGVPFERVMVFPQGWFSTPAMTALRANNYLAAINTTCFPTDEASTELTIADFLRPAVMRFDGLPVFQRRYPKRLIDCAFDLFLGRPAFLVEHHQYFQDGYEKLEQFVQGLQRIEPELTWDTLSSQVTRCCVMRTVSDSAVAIEFFTREFQFRNTADTPKTLSLAKVEPQRSLVSKVLVNGASVPFSFQNDFLVLEAAVDAGKTVNVEIVDSAQPAPSAHRPGWKYSVGVPVRRVLSEFRDNTLAKHPRALEVATGLARRMKTTADHDREDVA